MREYADECHHGKQDMLEEMWGFDHELLTEPYETCIAKFEDR